MVADWKKTLIRSTLTLREALAVLDASSQRILLVEDGELRLLGTITDGDIRRGLLNGLTEEDSITQFMTDHPIIAPSSMSGSELVNLMQEKSILAVPLVDGGVICGLATLENLLKNKQHDNPVFLMAGGFGTRLRPLTDSCPKPLLHVGEKPILERVLLNFVNEGFHDFYISTHYLAEKIMDYFGDGSRWGVTIQYVHEEEPLGTGGALGLLPDDLTDLPLLMINSDILTTLSFEKLLAYHNAEEADATMCVREYEYQVPYGVVTSKGNRILGMVEKPVQRFHVNAGVYVVSSSVVRSVPPNTYIDMPTLLEQHVELNNKVLMYPVHDYWLDIGRMDDFQRAQQDIMKLGECG
ncbi:nucleotidyltransferase family protein [Halodesulfovibrio marinisediminis]|uniref:CBS domain-containing protein n=1 Tax=Halodesulfovibrio marinisediminis DSM 17456 TaxID=1121457 RepID=A0A1N6FTP7_9BACT|nr:nucleotidyltransferase family protein [Halodesulfovibrio marinisediminis]SIN98597.1 CBS domain-containing protein [Halodesulfovibrio marinisediminis DSM 17456]